MECLTRMEGQGSPGGGKRRSSTAMEQRDRPGAPGRHDLWGVAGAQARAILPTGDSPPLRPPLLTRPRSSEAFQHPQRRGLSRRPPGEQRDDRLAPVALLRHGAAQLGDWCHVGPGAGQRAGHCATARATAHLDAASSPIPGRGLDGAGSGRGTGGDQIGQPTRLMVGARQHGVRRLLREAPPERPLGVQGSRPTDAPPQGPGRQPGLGHGHLLGLLVDGPRQLGCVTLLGAQAKPLWGGLGAGTSASDGLAIQGPWVRGGGDQGRLYPVGAAGCQRGHRQARDQPARAGARGTGKATWAQAAARASAAGRGTTVPPLRGECHGSAPRRHTR